MADDFRKVVRHGFRRYGLANISGRDTQRISNTLAVGGISLPAIPDVAQLYLARRITD